MNNFLTFIFNLFSIHSARHLSSTSLIVFFIILSVLYSCYCQHTFSLTTFRVSVLSFIVYLRKFDKPIRSEELIDVFMCYVDVSDYCIDQQVASTYTPNKRRQNNYPDSIFHFLCNEVRWELVQHIWSSNHLFSARPM